MLNIQRLSILVVWLVVFIYSGLIVPEMQFFGSSKDAFKQWFKQKLKKLLTMKDGFFNLSFQGSELIFEKKLSHLILKLIKLPVNYYGDLCVPEDELIPAMQGSPFYKCFSGLPPFSMITALLQAVTLTMTVMTHLIH
jgi:hypothetical protein